MCQRMLGSNRSHTGRVTPLAFQESVISQGSVNIFRQQQGEKGV